MSESTSPPEARTYVSLSVNTPLTAEWAGHVSSVVISHDRTATSGMPVHFAIHLDVNAAAKLASDLIHAVAESGAGEVPPELLAFILLAAGLGWFAIGSL